MTTLLTREETTDAPDLSAELLIAKARARRRKRHRSMAFALALVLVGLVITYGAGGVPSGGRTTRPFASAPLVTVNAVNALGVGYIDVSDVVGTRGQPPGEAAIAFGANSAWVFTNGPRSNAVVRLDGASGRIASEIRVPGFVVNIGFGGDHLWAESEVIGSRGYHLIAISPKSNRIVRTVVVDGGPRGVSFGGVDGSDPPGFAILGTTIFLNVPIANRTETALATISAVNGTAISMTADRSVPPHALIDGVDHALPLIGQLGVAENRPHGLQGDGGGRTITRFVDATEVGSVTWVSTLTTTATNKSEYLLPAGLNDHDADSVGDDVR